MGSLRELLEAELNTILAGNQENYRIELEDILGALTKASEDQKNKLLSRLWNMVLTYRRYNQGSRPPKLLKLIGESTEEYFERCFKAGHYLCGSTIINQLGR